VCSTRITNAQSWRCKLCDFDMCTKCASRKDAGTVGENLLRGDKGRRTEDAISSAAYLRRALGLAASDSPLLFWAFALLLAFAAANLALPDYQGKIIDQVVAVGQRDRQRARWLRRGLRTCFQLRAQRGTALPA
jgi:hypothetical protein